MTDTITLTTAYILGLIEADGSFSLTFGTGKSPERLRPYIRISQKASSNLLALIKSWFEKRNIECKYEIWNPNTSKGRAPNLTITKMESVREFIKLVKKEAFQFIGPKQRDFMILDCAVNSPLTLDISDKINLKKSLHKENSSQPDFDSSGAKTREQWESHFRVPLGTSRADSNGILSTIDANYAAHVEKIQKLIKNGNFSIPPDWLAGLIDGDGSYYITMVERAPSDRYSKAYIEIEGSFTLTMEKKALLTLEAVKAAVGSQGNIVEYLEHYQFWIRKQSEVIKLLEMQKAFLPVCSHRLEQYKAVELLHIYKKAGKMRDLETIENVIRKAYAISETTKGRRRTRSLEEMIQLAKKIYG